MRATARRRRTGTFQHDIKIREHFVGADEPQDAGGDDAAPSPQELLAASLASCTAVTMEMYAARKGWDVGPSRSTSTTRPPSAAARRSSRWCCGCPSTSPRSRSSA